MMWEYLASQLSASMAGFGVGALTMWAYIHSEIYHHNHKRKDDR